MSHMPTFYRTVWVRDRYHGHHLKPFKFMLVDNDYLSLGILSVGKYIPNSPGPLLLHRYIASESS